MASLVCAVLSCPHNSNQSKKKLPYFKFPRDPAVLTKWIQFTGRPSTWRPTIESRICCDHFSAKCFINLNSTRLLTVEAVPTLLTGSKSIEKKDEAVKSADGAAVKQSTPAQQIMANFRISKAQMGDTPIRFGSITVKTKSSTPIVSQTVAKKAKTEDSPFADESFAKYLSRTNFQNIAKNVKITKVSVDSNAVLNVGQIKVERKTPAPPVQVARPKSKANTSMDAVNESKENADSIEEKQAEHVDTTSKYLNEFLDFVDDYREQAKPTKKPPSDMKQPSTIATTTATTETHKNTLPQKMPVVQTKAADSSVHIETKQEPQEDIEDIEYLEDDFNGISDYDEFENEPETDEDRNVQNDPLLPTKKNVPNKKHEEEHSDEMDYDDDMNDSFRDLHSDHDSDDRNSSMNSSYDEFESKLCTKINNMEKAVKDILGQLKLLRRDVKIVHANHAKQQNESNRRRPRLPFTVEEKFLNFDNQCKKNKKLCEFIADEFNECTDTEWKAFFQRNMDRLLSARMKLRVRHHPDFNIDKSAVIKELINCTLKRFPATQRASLMATAKGIIFCKR